MCVTSYSISRSTGRNMGGGQEGFNPPYHFGSSVISDITHEYQLCTGKSDYDPASSSIRFQLKNSL